MSAAEWFPDWLKAHKRRNPHHKFSEYEEGDEAEVYEGWIDAFDRHHIDRERATKASRRMQEEDKQNLYPEHHLAKLIDLDRKLIESKCGDVIAAKDSESKLQYNAVDEEQIQINAAWGRLKPSIKDQYRDIARSEYPVMRGIKGYIEFMAMNRWADTVRPGNARPNPIRPSDQPEALLTTETPARISVCEVPEPEPTPGQREFLSALTVGQRETLEAMTPAKRRIYLAPHAEAFNPRLLSVIAHELAPRRARTMTSTKADLGAVDEPTSSSDIEPRLQPAV